MSIEKTENSDIIIKNAELGNKVTACLYLKEASDLLKYDEPELSMILLQLIKTTLEQLKISENELQQIKQLTNEIKTSTELKDIS